MVITLIQQGESRRQTFKRGLWKGLASPLMLFASNRASLDSVQLAPLPRVEPVRLPASLTTMTDLQRIGADFSAAVRRYEQAGTQHPAVGDQAG